MATQLQKVNVINQTPIDTALRYYGSADQVFNLMNDLNLDYQSLNNSSIISITPKNNNTNVNYYNNNNNIQIQTYQPYLITRPLTAAQLSIAGLYIPLTPSTQITGSSISYNTGLSYLTINNAGGSSSVNNYYSVSIEYKTQNGTGNTFYNCIAYPNSGLSTIAGNTNKLYQLNYSIPIVLVNKHRVQITTYSGGTLNSQFGNIIKDSFFDIVYKPVVSVSNNYTGMTNSNQVLTTTINMTNPYNTIVDYILVKNIVYYNNISGTTQLTGSSIQSIYYTLSGATNTIIFNFSGSTFLYKSGIGQISTIIYDRYPFENPGQTFVNNFNWSF